MDYVIRTLDVNGKLRKERFMFYSVRILDKKRDSEKGSKRKITESKILGVVFKQNGQKT